MKKRRKCTKIIFRGDQNTCSITDVPVREAVRLGIIQQAEQDAAAAAEHLRTDQITTVLCGTMSPIARSGAETGTAVFVNGKFLLFDIGNNVLQSINGSNIPIAKLDAVFITHYHGDHYADLGEAISRSWVNGRRHILPIYGPSGLTQIVDSFNAAYELDRSYRTAHHGEAVMPPEWASTETHEFPTPRGEQWIVYEEDGVVVRALTVDHHPANPAVGYRIEYAGKSVVITGDTVLTPELPGFSQDADLLVSEVMNKQIIEWMEDTYRELGNDDVARIAYDIREYHMDVSDVAKLAQQSQPARLALTHFTPAAPNESVLRQWYVEPIQAVYDGEIFAGGDGLTVVIPLDEA
jgi:ribonuclease Z